MASEKREEPKQMQRLRKARRTMTYVVRTLLLIIMACIVCIAAFLTAERVANLYILTSEGMLLRADCILADGARSDMEEYFTLTFLETDASTTDTTYDHYTITSYNYDLSVERISVLPWSMVASVTAVERVTMKGTINADQLADGESASDYALPPWTNARYKIHFINADGRWYISSLEVLEENARDEALGTPDSNQTPIPAATPTPKPTEEPLASPAA